MQKYFDLVKEFCLKYKRYFGAAALFIVLVVVLAMCTGPVEQVPDRKDKDTQNAGTEINKPGDSVQPEVKLEGALEHNANEELAALITNYYNAYANADMEALETLASLITDNEKGYINAFAAYAAAYQNIECYSMQVSDEEAYFVSVCYDLKFIEVDTLAPGMDFFYVERDGRGNLIINNVYSSYNFNFMEQEFDSNIYQMILSYEQMEEVTALQQEVQARYDEAVAGDEKLAKMVNETLRNAIMQWRATVLAQETQTPEPTEQDTQEGGEPEDSQTQEPENNNENPGEGDTNEPENPDDNESTPETVTTKDVCNIRASASTDSDLIGQVGEGVTLTVVGTEGNWTKIQFSGGEGYIRNDLLERD